MTAGANEWEDAHVRPGLARCVRWEGRRGSGTSRGARSAEQLPGHPGDLGAEVEAAERSPVSHRDRVCRDDAVPSADTARAKGTSALTFLAISDFGSS